MAIAAELALFGRRVELESREQTYFRIEFVAGAVADRYKRQRPRAEVLVVVGT